MRPMTKRLAEIIFRQPMQPCPKCGSYNMRPQNPIKLQEDVSAADLKDPRKLLGKWARAHRDGPPMLEGPCFLMCFDCFHKGPAVDCSGRTSEEVGKDPEVFTEMKRLWNEQGKESGAPAMGLQ